jgi:uncharacterized protein (TIGR03437 family)
MAAPATAVKARLPVLFERNGGEFPLLARGQGYALLLGRGELRLRQAGAGTATIRFAGASQRPSPEPMLPSNTLVNDYTGGQANWRAGAPAWERAEYRNLYPEIDLLFYGNGGQIEYDALVSPGGDPRRIVFACEGVAPRLEASGDLSLPLGKGSVTWHKPVAYQTIGGRRVAVEAAFTVKGRRVGFSVRAWDRRYPLTIDPTLSFSTFLGGSGSDYLRGIAVDASGNVYVSGSTSSGDLPVTAASYESAYKEGGAGYGGPRGAFVAKLNATATAITYITYLGGTVLDSATAITADSSGNAYVTGFTDSPDFPVTSGAYQTAFGGDQGVFTTETGDAFVTKFDPAGKLVWSTFLGGANNDLAGAIALDSSGNVVVVGATQSANFPVTKGAFQTAYGGGEQPQVPDSQGYVTIDFGDGFVAKLNPTGTSLLASTFLGGSGNDMVGAVTIDSQGNIWVGGSTSSNNFPTSANALQRTYGGESSQQLQAIIQLGDGFVAEFSSDLTKLMYSTYLGGANDDAITGVAVDSSGEVYVCGFTQSSNFPVKGASAGSYHGPATPPEQNPYLLGDAFVAKLTPASGLIFSEYIGGQLDDAAGGLVLDGQGNAVITGITNSSDFPATSGALRSTYGGAGAFPYNGLGDGFLTQVNGSTGAILYSTFIGGSNSDALYSVAVNPSTGLVYAVGTSFSANFPTTPGIIQPALNTKVAGTSDSVIMAFTFPAGQTGAPAPTIGGVANAASYATGTYSPGEIVTIFGQNLGPAALMTAQIASNGKLATELGNAEVLFDGQAAPLVYVSATQSAAVIPYEVAGKASTQMTVSYNSLISAATALPIGAAKPGLFSVNEQGNGQGAIYNQNATLNSSTNPESPGNYIALYGTGEGLLNPPGSTGTLAPTAPPFPTFAGSISVTIGGVPVPASGIAYAGPVPGFVEGEFQMNVQIPATVPAGNQPVVLTIAGVSSPSTLTVAVK